MRNRRHFCWLMLLAGVLRAAAREPEEEIRQLAKHYIEIRNAKDPEALRQLFTADADQLVSSGEWRHGLEDLVQGAMASSRRENGQSSLEIESVRMLGPDIAIADGRYETTVAGATMPRKMWSTLVVRRTQEGWRITAIRNMLPAGTSR